MKAIADEFKKNGYVVLPQLYSEEQCDDMSKEMGKIVDEVDIDKHRITFADAKHNESDYFLKSSQNCSFFFAKAALMESGELAVPRQQAFNKIGHGLMMDSDVFRRNTFCPEIERICKTIGYVRPTVMQSMYIFKQPRIGEEVTIHQDGVFLYNDPLKLMGIWIALDDATLENGCLWFVPGSHKDGIIDNTRMVRGPSGSEFKTVFTGKLPSAEEYGKHPDWKPVEVKRGDAIAIDGAVLHYSATNKSEKQRNIYTFHIADLPEGATWPASNWIQSQGRPFPVIY